MHIIRKLKVLNYYYTKSIAMKKCKINFVRLS
jgi:hypothetical protein